MVRTVLAAAFGKVLVALVFKYQKLILIDMIFAHPALNLLTLFNLVS